MLKFGVMGVFLVASMQGACGISPALQSVLDMGGLLPFGKKAATPPQLNPQYLYLKIVIDGRPAYFAQGYQDPSSSGPIDVWYSSEREVLKIQNGRVMAAIGTPSEWRYASYLNAPVWSDRLDGVEYEREVDLSPGYRYGLKDTLRLRRIAVPKSTQLEQYQASNLVWYQEEPVGKSVIPPAIYALKLDKDEWQVVYSEVCLDASLCFSWQRWKP